MSLKHTATASSMSADPWSFSKIKSFQQCPKQFYHEKVIKQYPFKMTAAVRYGDQFHRAAEHYIKDGAELDRRFTYAKPALDRLNNKSGDKLCEYRMGLTRRLEPCSFYAQDVWFRGIADLLILNEDDRLAHVVDYKTGKSAKYADRGQLELMALSVFRHFPYIETVKAALLFVVSMKWLPKNTYEMMNLDCGLNGSAILNPCGWHIAMKYGILILMGCADSTALWLSVLITGEINAL